MRAPPQDALADFITGQNKSKSHFQRLQAVEKLLLIMLQHWSNTN
jgi:hypothetical protein